MVSSKRHNSLTTPSMISVTRTPRKPRKNTGMSAASHQSKARSNLAAAQSELRSERKELKKFTIIAKRHSKASDFEQKDTPELLREIIVRLDRNFFRAAYTSSAQQKTQVKTILDGLQSKEVFEDPVALEEIGEFVMKFLLKHFESVMVPAVFPGVKLLRKEWAAAKDDDEFTQYNLLAMDKQRFWNLVKQKRSKYSERLNAKIFSMFETILGHTDYEAAMASAGRTLSAQWSIEDEISPKWECELLFGYKVVEVLDLYRIVSDWAGDAGQDVDDSVKSHLPALLSTRAEHKGMPSLNSHFEKMYMKLQKVIGLDDRKDSDDSRSEPQLSLPQTQDLLADEELEELFADLEDSEKKTSSKPVKKKTLLPNSQASSRILSWMSESEEETIEVGKPKDPEAPKKKSKKPRVTFTFGSKKKTTAKRKMMSRPQLTKRARFTPPQLPSLEPLDN